MSNFEKPSAQRAEINIQGDVATLISGELKSINMDHPDGIEITHMDGTIEVLRGVKRLEAKNLDVKGDFTM